MRPTNKSSRKAVNKRQTWITKKAHPEDPVAQSSFCLLYILANLVPLGSFFNYHTTERRSPETTELDHQSIDNRRVAPHTRKARKISLVSQRWNHKKFRSVAHAPKLSFITELLLVFSGHLPEWLRYSIMRRLARTDENIISSYNRLRGKTRSQFVNVVLGQLPIEKNGRVRTLLLHVAYTFFACIKIDSWPLIKLSYFAAIQKNLLEPGWQRAKVWQILYDMRNEGIDDHVDTELERRLIANAANEMIAQHERDGPQMTDDETKYMMQYMYYFIGTDTIDMLIDGHFISFMVDALVEQKYAASPLIHPLSECLSCLFTPSTDRTTVLIRFWTRLESIFINLEPSFLCFFTDDAIFLRSMKQSMGLFHLIVDSITRPHQSLSKYRVFYLAELAHVFLRDATDARLQELLGYGFLSIVRIYAHERTRIDPIPIYQRIIRLHPECAEVFKQMTAGGNPTLATTIFGQSLPAIPMRRGENYALEWDADLI